jgi:hypothetical protein
MSDQDPPAAPVPPSSSAGSPTYPGYPTPQASSPEYPSFPTGGPQSYERGQPPPSKTKAGWALGLAIVPAPLAWIVSLILAIQVISDSKHQRGNGKGLAIAALVIIPVWILIVIGFVIATMVDNADRDASGVVTHTGDVLATDLRPGDCTADDLAEKTYTTIQVTPCGSAHYFETYATFVLADGGFPGQDEVDRLAEGGCFRRFESYVGVPAADSKLEVLYLRPFESSWALDRGVACLVSSGSQSTDSVKGVKR